MTGVWVRWDMPDMTVSACYVGNTIVAVTASPPGGFIDYVADLR